MREASSSFWLVSFGLLVFTMVAVPLLIFEDNNFPRYQSLRAELTRAEESSVQLAREVQVLKRQVQKLKTDPRAVERIARDDLGMVMPGELVFQFQQ